MYIACLVGFLPHNTPSKSKASGVELIVAKAVAIEARADSLLPDLHHQIKFHKLRHNVKQCSELSTDNIVRNGVFI
jgi:hypothetical protein